MLEATGALENITQGKCRKGRCITPQALLVRSAGVRSL